MKWIMPIIMVVIMFILVWFQSFLFYYPYYEFAGGVWTKMGSFKEASFPCFRYFSMCSDGGDRCVFTAPRDYPSLVQKNSFFVVSVSFSDI